MQTIRLQVNNNVYKNLMRFLSRFKKDEISIIQENENFLSVQGYLKNELIYIEKDKPRAERRFKDELLERIKEIPAMP